jgi:hypothetical protein
LIALTVHGAPLPLKTTTLAPALPLNYRPAARYQLEDQNHKRDH